MVRVKDLPKVHSAFYGKILTEQFRREYLRFLRDNYPDSLRQIKKDHKITLEQFHVVV